MMFSCLTNSIIQDPDLQLFVRFAVTGLIIFICRGIWKTVKRYKISVKSAPGKFEIRVEKIDAIG